MQPLNKAAGTVRPEIHGAGVPSEELVRPEAASKPLPRFVKRFIRAFENFSLDELVLTPKFFMACALSLTVGAGVYLTGDDRVLGSALASMSSEAGFNVARLVINGNQHLAESDIEGQLSPVLGKSLISLDVAEANQQMTLNPWVKASEIKKVYPDTLVVDLVERQPVALWKSAGQLILISRDGIAIDEAQARHMHLPQVVGEGANTVASEFLTTISRFPDLVRRAEAYVRVANRRWNLVLDDGLQVLLPAEGWPDALAELDLMQSNKQILDRELVQIDMRLPDRLVLRLAPEAAKVRKTRIEEIMKRDWHKT